MPQTQLRLRDFSNKYHKQSHNCKQLYNRILNQTESGISSPYLLLMDRLPQKSGLESQLEYFRKEQVSLSDIILVFFEGQEEDKKNAWELIETGIRDIYFYRDESDYVNYVESLIRRKLEVAEILESPMVKKNLVGESRIWKQFLSQIIEVGIFSQSSFLLIGDSGTGKELISRLIHTIDRRPNKKELILVDCTTIVEELAGSEFFGHERGAYTNALQAREGAFALADKGSLFLDEIGELPMHLQAELLRVIQEGTYKKVGSNHWHKTSFRLICATHRNLRLQVNQNLFREDLFFRISDFEFRVPTLAERVEDIPLLAGHFLKEFFPGNDCPQFEPCVLEYLVRRTYHGNARELRQLIQRIALRHVNHQSITLGEVPVEDRQMMNNHQPVENENIYLEVSLKKAILSGASLWDLKNKTMDDAIRVALQLTNGNKKLAAEKLGVTSRAVQQFLKNKRISS